jgi:two-component system, sensor histidine kinase and response regulator
MTKSLRFAFVAALVVLVGSALTTFWNISRIETISAWVAHTHEALAQLAGIRTRIVNEETLERNFLLTGREDFLKAREQSDASVAESIDQVERLTADNLSQASRIRQLRLKIAARLDLFRTTIAAQRMEAGNIQNTLNIVISGIGPNIMNEARLLLTEMELEERRLLDLREAESRASATTASLTLATSTALGLVLLGAAYFLTKRDYRRRKQVTDSLRQVGQELELRVRDRTAELAAVNDSLRHEIAERLASEAGLRLERLRYRSLVETTSAIVWNVPASGEVRGELPGWTKFTGQTTKQIQEWGWLEAVHPADRERTARAWSSAVANQSPYEIEHRMRRHDGEYREMHARGVPIIDQATATVEWVGVHVDETEQKRAQNALFEAKEAAESVSRAKSEFLANMSHEIRTPMNGILGMTDLVLDTELTQDQRDCLETVKTSADSLLTIINDILDFSKIEAGKVELDLHPFPLRDSLADMLTPLSLRANAKGVELAYHVTPATPDALVGDLGRIRQVIVNLVGNAIKFTEKGQVVLQVEAVPNSVGSLELHAAVIDTGIGIPAERLEAIFEPFIQADGSTTRKFGGTGLGLSISARLVELMGGRIWAESEMGRGTSFHFTARLDAEAASDLPSQKISGDELHILLAGGTPTHQGILAEMLTQWRMRPTRVDFTTATAEELERAASAGDAYAVLLLDISQEESENPELIAAIFQSAAAAKTPVVLLKTALPKNVAVWHAPDGTVTLEKPIRQSRLLEAIQALVAATRTATGDEGDAKEPVARPPTDPRQLRVLLVDDNRINQAVGTRLMQRDGHLVTVAGSGEEALAILEREMFDVCLMDIQMPGMDGLEATAKLRQREKQTGRRLPVIALTAHAMKGDRERCLDAGMDSYLSKPVRAEELRMALAELAILKPNPKKGAISSGNLQKKTRANGLSDHHKTG